MLLQQLIHQPTTSSKMLVCDPFRLPDQEQLVKEVIGLANADVDGPRYILFGINAGAMDANQAVGIGDDDMADLKKAHCLVSALIEPPPMRVGFNDEPDCGLLELDIPDCSDPPFVEELQEASKPRDLKQTIRDTVGTMTSKVLKLASGRKAASGAKSGEHGTGEHTGIIQASGSLFGDAQNHYFFEEKALQLSLSVCNDGEQSLKEVSIELGIPKLPDFDVADRMYISPFDKRSQNEVDNLGYPEVERRGKGIMVRDTLGALDPGAPKQAFKSALRLAVGPAMVGKKVAINYTLRGRNEQTLAEGRLKIVFGKILE